MGSGESVPEKQIVYVDKPVYIKQEPQIITKVEYKSIEPVCKETITKFTEYGIKNINLMTDCGKFESLTSQEAIETGIDLAESCEGDYTPEMCKKIAVNFKMTAKGQKVDKKNNMATCIIQVQEDGKVEINAVQAQVLGDGLYDMAYILSKGEFDIKLPQKLVVQYEPTQNEWGVTYFKENETAKSMGLQDGQSKQVIKDMLDCIFATTVGINQEDFRASLEEKAQNTKMQLMT